MGSTAVAKRISMKRLTPELREAIDIASDVFAPGRTPTKYAQAIIDLTTIVTNEDIWSVINHIEDGRKSNHLLHNLGAERIEWLRKFREQRLNDIR